MTLNCPSSTLAGRYAAIRAATLRLTEGLSAEDCQVQSMPDASPTKWHLAHTTWFFETFVLERLEPDARPFDPAYRMLFNSYYHAVGEKHPRPRRGLVTRPDLDTIVAYRHQVDERLVAWLQRPLSADDLALVELGLQHEQQHQELILTDLLHLLSCNPLMPAYRAPRPRADATAPALQWVGQAGGVVHIGHTGPDFAFDNETPRHRVFLAPYALANRLVTQGEWLEFIADGGYRDPKWWLAAGWDWVQDQGIEAPLYWLREGAAWRSFTLRGCAAVDPASPVVHVNCFEADAYARWKGATDARFNGARLPTEAEWEHAAAAVAAPAIAAGSFVDGGALHPQPASVAASRLNLQQLFGEVWQWTSSSYGAYPGYRPWAGAAGEYNGKFMINQQVLRGGSCATPRAHVRASYRNFFPADARWQFSGLRLACSLE